MIEKIEPWIKGKRILLLGYGREGQSTWNVLRRLGTYEVLDIADLKAPAAVPEDGTVWHTGPDYQKCMDDYDVVFKSPGIVLERPEKEYKCSILSQTEVFSSAFGIRLSESREPRARVRSRPSCITCLSRRAWMPFWWGI